MRVLIHQSAESSHYDEEAENYDAFNEENSALINQIIETMLKEHGVQTVADFTCGTGSQVFWLTQRGYEVVGSDINARMLKIAQEKARAQNLKIRFIQGDMRNVALGTTFGAAITMFNAVGHLTKLDFEIAMRNIRKNLKPGSLYIFDIFNLNYLLHANNITKLTIDWQRITGATKIRDIQYSTIDEDGILASYTTSCAQMPGEPPKISKSFQTLQVYTAMQLREMLEKNGFSVINQCNIDGSKLIETESERILTIAKAI